MCGKNFKNFDCTDWKIIMFEIKINFFLSLLDMANKLLLLLKWYFCSTHGFFFTLTSCIMWDAYLPNFKNRRQVLYMLPELIGAAWKVHSNITFDLDNQLEKKLHSFYRDTYSHLVSNFEEHPLKKWLHMHLPEITSVRSTIIRAFRV